MEQNPEIQKFQKYKNKIQKLFGQNKKIESIAKINKINRNGLENQIFGND